MKKLLLLLPLLYILGCSNNDITQYSNIKDITSKNKKYEELRLLKNKYLTNEVYENLR